MAGKRIGLSKKLRFEIFKRDGFECQYCGATPPGVLLHVDHIVPVTSGGTNDIDNLITACQPCNAGKGARELSEAPKSLAEKAKEVAEREAQLAGYGQVMDARRQRIEDESWRVMDVIYPGQDSVPRSEFLSVSRFVERLGVYEVLDATEIAAAAKLYQGKVFRYFCGVCWNKIRASEERAA